MRWLKLLTEVSERCTRDIPAPQWTNTDPFLRSTIIKNGTLFYSSIWQFKINSNFLLLCVHEWKYDMGEFRRDLKMLKSTCSSDYSPDIVLFDDLLISSWIKISEEKSACVFWRRQDNVMRLVLLLSIIIEKHTKKK